MSRRPDRRGARPAALSHAGDGGSGVNQSPPSPGDLFVVREVAEFPLEWAVITRDRRDRTLLLVVPADAHPAAGSADIRVPARASAGPLVLRCRFGVWVTDAFLAASVRSGRLDPADRLRAERRIDELAQDPSPSDPLGRETDRDPEYLDWISETVALGAEALEAAARAAPTSRPQVPAGRWPHRPVSLPALAAAALLLAVLGLSWRMVWLQHRIDDLSRPLFDAPHGEVPLGFGARNPDHSPVRVRVPRGTGRFLVTILLGPELPAGQAGHLELQDTSGRSLWRSQEFSLAPARELPFILSRELLPGPAYRLVLYARDRSAPLERRTLEIETSAP